MLWLWGERAHSHSISGQPVHTSETATPRLSAACGPVPARWGSAPEGAGGAGGGQEHHFQSFRELALCPKSAGRCPQHLSPPDLWELSEREVGMVPTDHGPGHARAKDDSSHFSAQRGRVTLRWEVCAFGNGLNQMSPSRQALEEGACRIPEENPLDGTAPHI